MDETGLIVDREKAYWEVRDHFKWLTDESIRKVISLSLETGGGGDILELCSGSGAFTKHMPREFRSYTCLDISQTLLQTVKRSLPEVTVVQGDAQNPAFKEESFYLVVMFAGLHHMPDVKATLRNAFRILRSGGAFVCFEPNDDCWYRRFMLPLKSLLGIYTEDERFLKVGFIQAALQEAGFATSETKFLMPEYAPDHLKSALNKILVRFMALASSLGTGPFWQPWFIMSGRKL